MFFSLRIYFFLIEVTKTPLFFVHDDGFYSRLNVEVLVDQVGKELLRRFISETVIFFFFSSDWQKGRRARPPADWPSTHKTNGRGRRKIKRVAQTQQTRRREKYITGPDYPEFCYLFLRLLNEASLSWLKLSEEKRTKKKVFLFFRQTNPENRWEDEWDGFLHPERVRATNYRSI